MSRSGTSFSYQGRIINAVVRYYKMDSISGAKTPIHVVVLLPPAVTCCCSLCCCCVCPALLLLLSLLLLLLPLLLLLLLPLAASPTAAATPKFLLPLLLLLLPLLLLLLLLLPLLLLLGSRCKRRIGGTVYCSVVFHLKRIENSITRRFANLSGCVSFIFRSLCVRFVPPIDYGRRSWQLL